MLRSALIVALAAPPAAAGPPGAATPSTSVPWGPLPGSASSGTSGDHGDAGSSSQGQVSADMSQETVPPEAPAPAPEGRPEAAPTSQVVPAPAAATASAPATRASAEATLVLTGAGQGGEVLVSSPRGELLGAYSLRAGESLALQGPPGEYVVRSPEAPHGLVVPVVGRARVQVGGEGGLTVVRDEGPVNAPIVRVEPHRGRERGQWRRPVAPLLSAIIPGSGQMLNGEPARGAAFLLGTLSLGAGALGLALARDPSDAATSGAHGRTFATEAVSAVGLGLLTGGLHLLYTAQVMDAYAGAAGKRSPKPHNRHRLALELRRMATVGMRAGDPAAQLYADWNLGVLGQVAPRFSVGLTDLGLKFGAGRASLQGGPRLSYRVLERGRVWLSLAAGAIVQGTFASGTPPALKPGEPAPRTAAVAAIPYGQLDLRLFILDRWSIDIVPRVSAPLGGARYYRQDGAIPKRALTLELGTGMGVYF